MFNIIFYYIFLQRIQLNIFLFLLQFQFITTIFYFCYILVKKFKFATQKINNFFFNLKNVNRIYIQTFYLKKNFSFNQIFFFFFFSKKK